MKPKDPFKPLWRVHNKTYRQYVRGTKFKRFLLYTRKLRKFLKIKS